MINATVCPRQGVESEIVIGHVNLNERKAEAYG